MRAPIAKGEGGQQVALAAAGLIGAILAGGHRTIAIAGVVIGGALGLANTYIIGHLFGTAIA